MSQVKLDLAAMSAIEKAQFALVVADALGKNDTTFTDPTISSDDLNNFAVTVRQSITTAQVAHMAWRSKVAAQNEKLATLELYLRQTASYVQNVSAGDASIIELAALSVREPNGKIGRLPAPAGIEVQPASNPGMVTLKLTPVKKAKGYLVQFAASASLPATFPHSQALTKSKLTITGLTSATRYWFRAAATNPAGLGEWTDPVSVVTQ